MIFFVRPSIAYSLKNAMALARTSRTQLIFKEWIVWLHTFTDKVIFCSEVWRSNCLIEKCWMCVLYAFYPLSDRIRGPLFLFGSQIRQRPQITKDFIDYIFLESRFSEPPTSQVHIHFKHWKRMGSRFLHSGLKTYDITINYTNSEPISILQFNLEFRMDSDRT